MCHCDCCCCDDEPAHGMPYFDPDAVLLVYRDGQPFTVRSGDLIDAVNANAAC